MFNRLFLLKACICIGWLMVEVTCVGAQEWQWANYIKAAYQSNSIGAIATDQKGNIYTGINYQGAPTLPNGNQLSDNSVTALVKFSPDSSVRWANTIGGGRTFPKSTDMKVDGEGNIVTLNMITIPDHSSTTGSGRGIVRKYKPNGDLIWKKTYNSTGLVDDNEDAWLAIGPENGVYIRGTIHEGRDNGMADKNGPFPDRPGTSEAIYGDHAYMIKYNAQGKRIWGYTLEGDFESTYGDIKVDSNGNLWISGYFRELADFGKKAFDRPPLSAYGEEQVSYIAKYDTSGTFKDIVTSKRFKQGAWLMLEGFSFGNNGTINIWGHLEGKMIWGRDTIGNNKSNQFYGRLSDLKTIDWIRTKEIKQDQITYLKEIKTYESGLSHLVGYYEGTVNLGGKELGSAAKSPFMAMIDRKGNFKWIKGTGGGHDDIIENVAFHKGKVYAGGYFKSSTKLAGNERFTGSTITENGFLLKLSSCIKQPVLPNDYPDTAICEGEPLVYKANLNASSFNYTWTKGSEEVSTSSKLSYNKVSSENAGIHQLKVNNSCGEDRSNYFKLSVKAQPDFDIAIDYPGNNGSEVTLSPSKTFRGYEWYNGDTTKTLQVPMDKVNRLDSLRVWLEVQSENGCKNWKQVKVYSDQYLNTTERTQDQAPEVYPVPAEDRLNVDFNQKAGSHQVTLISGKGIEQRSLVIRGSHGQINLNGLASGMYWLRVKGADKECLKPVPVVD